MSDFDDALERLIGDPEFRAALAADPERALAGYTLSADERELLGAQVDGGTGGERQVEQRTSKAGLFGLLSPLGGTGLSDALRGGDVVPGGGGGDGHIGGITRGGEPFAPGRGFHTGGGIGIGGHGTSGPGITTGGVLPGMPDVPAADSAPSHGSFAPAGGTLHDTSGGGTLHDASGGGTDALTGAHDRVAPAEHGTLADRPYHTRVDADGDGRWDDFTAVDRGAHGYDLVVDSDGDGRADFVGHDYDRDGLIDAATTDDDGDGRLDTTWVDTDGDGWLDRRAALPEEPPAPGGGRHRAD